MSRTQEQMTSYEKALAELVQHILTEYGGDTVRFYEDMRKAKAAPEPAEPRTCEDILTGIPRYLLSHQLGGDSRMETHPHGAWVQLFDVQRLFPPGWKLVKEDAEPEWRYFRDDDGDFYKMPPVGNGLVKRRGVGEWEACECGLTATINPLNMRHFGTVETDATGKPLHAANFGEVGR